MAIPHAKSGDSIDVRPLGPNLANTKTAALVKSDRLEVIRLVVLANKEIAPHQTNAVPKIHPATRAVEPDDPLNLHGVEVDGDPEIMLRMLVEEYARMGWGANEIMRLADDPFYVAFHGLVQHFGQAGLRDRVETVLCRVGVTRVRMVEAPTPESLVQLTGRWS